MKEKLFKDIYENVLLEKLADSLPILMFLVICISSLFEPSNLFKVIIGLLSIVIVIFSVTYKILYFINYRKISKEYNTKKAQLYFNAIKNLYEDEILKITNKKEFRSFLMEKIAECEVEIDVIDAKASKPFGLDFKDTLEEKQTYIERERLFLNMSRLTRYINFI